MATRKTAIAVPPELLAAIDDAARERGESRSRYINRVLREAVRARRDREITRRLDALFADEELAGEQRHVARQIGEATGWDDERW